MKPRILTVLSMASGRSLDSRVVGECISLVGELDGGELDGETVHFLIPQASWEKIVRNADWFRHKEAK
jgi:hypothetical protein